MKIRWVLVLTLVFLFTFHSMARAENVIKLGAAVSMSGAQARFGNMVKNGYEVWKDYVNDAGGITVGKDKFKVNVIYYDDQSDSQTSARLTEKLITDDKVQFLLGPFSSGITFSTSAIAEKYNMINMSTVANADNVYTRGYKNIFAVLPPSSVMLHSFLDMLKTFNPVPKRIAFFCPPDLFSLSAAEAGQKYAKEIGLDVVFFEQFPKEAKDLSSLFLKIKAQKADVLIGTGFLDDGILAIRQCKDLKVSLKAILFTTGPELADFTKNLGKDADYVYGASWWMPDMNYNCPLFGSTKKYADLFTKKYGPGITYQAAAATQGGLLLQLALQKAGSLDVDKVREALRSYDGTTFWGRNKFDAAGRNTVGKSVTFQIQKGVIKTVFPKESAGAAPMFPQVPWSDR